MAGFLGTAAGWLPQSQTGFAPFPAGGCPAYQLARLLIGPCASLPPARVKICVWQHRRVFAVLMST